MTSPVLNGLLNASSNPERKFSPIFLNAKPRITAESPAPVIMPPASVAKPSTSIEITNPVMTNIHLEIFSINPDNNWSSVLNISLDLTSLLSFPDMKTNIRRIINAVSIFGK